MTTIFMTTIQAKEEFTELVNRVAHNNERIVLTRRDKQVAAIVPLEDLLVLEQHQSKSDLDEALEALQEARAQGTMTLDDMKEELG